MGKYSKESGVDQVLVIEIELLLNPLASRSLFPSLVLLLCEGKCECLFETVRVVVTEVVMVLMELDKRTQREVRILANRWELNSQ